MNSEKKKIEKKENKKTSKINSTIIIILLTLSATLLAIVPNIYVKLAIILFMVIYLIYAAARISSKNKADKETKTKQKELSEKIQILEQNKEKLNIELEKIKTEYDGDLEKIANETKINNLENILELIDIKQRKINEQTLNLHTLKIDNNNIIPKLEKLVNIEEELESLKETKLELEEKRDNIKRTIEYLEIAYNKMKEQIIKPNMLFTILYIQTKSVRICQGIWLSLKSIHFHTRSSLTVLSR